MNVMVAGVRGPGARSKGRRFGIFAVGAIALLVVAVWAARILLTPHPPSPASITRAMRAQAALTGGEKVYVTHCAYCHDTGFGPVIAHAGLVVQAVQAAVRTGPAMMPAFPPSQVSDADIAAVARYIDGGATKG